MSASFLLATLAQAGGDDGLTLREILEDLPTDPASLFAIFLLLAFTGMVLWYGTRSGGQGNRKA